MKSTSTFLLGFTLLFLSCVPDEEFGLPAAEDTVVPGTNTSLNAILGAFYQNPDGLVTIEQDYIFEAYVVSSDEAGNFYKELVIQDRPQNPVAGINIKLNMNSYFQYFNFGRKVYIKAKGLSIANMNGVPTMGIANGRKIDNIPQSKITDHVVRSGEVAEIVPLTVEALEFSDRLENLFVKVENVQFSSFLVNPQEPFTYASAGNDEFDGERLIESCNGDFPFVLSTSTYADFKGFPLPSGSGSIQGVLTRDYYDEFYTIYLNSPDDLDFSNNKRCDPAILNCGIAETVGSKILFSEDFTSQTNNKPVKGNGWTNYIEEGSKPWEAFTATGANASLGRSARMRPGGSGDYKSVSWLISPKINFAKNTGEFLNFKSSTSFANGSLLDVLISTNWDGNEENFRMASWKILSAAYLAQNSDYFGDWISSGYVDLSCVEGEGHIAFRYTGSDLANYNGVYELDDIIIGAD